MEHGERRSHAHQSVLVEDIHYSAIFRTGECNTDTVRGRGGEGVWKEATNELRNYIYIYLCRKHMRIMTDELHIIICKRASCA